VTDEEYEQLSAVAIGLPVGLQLIARHHHELDLLGALPG
jgi:Asp-tRNA(Asn)/Glu-tRNA(Gln) amidotransferase A subunit family amidase